MEDKELIKYYKNHNILKAPDEFESPENYDGEPEKKCPFCGFEQDESDIVDIRDLDKKYVKVNNKLKYLLYYGIIKCEVKKCDICGAIWHGDAFTYDDESLDRRFNIIFSLLLLLSIPVMIFCIMKFS